MKLRRILCLLLCFPLLLLTACGSSSQPAPKSEKPENTSDKSSEERLSSEEQESASETSASEGNKPEGLTAEELGYKAEHLGFANFDWLTVKDATYDWQYSVIEEDGMYKIWWTRGNPHDVIFYAESTDLMTWADGQCVLRPDKNTQWIKDMLGHPSVLHVGDTYYMYFEAPATLLESGECDNSVFLATSTDGKDWTIYPSNEDPQPIIRMDESAMGKGKYGVGQPHALYIDGEFRLYYCDVVNSNTVKLAKSADGIDFGKTSTHLRVFDRNGFGVVYNSELELFIGTFEMDSVKPRACNVYLTFSKDGVRWNPPTRSSANDWLVTRGNEDEVVRSFPDIVHDAYGCITGDSFYVGYLQGEKMADPDQDWRVTWPTWDPYFTKITLLKDPLE